MILLQCTVARPQFILYVVYIIQQCNTINNDRIVKIRVKRSKVQALYEIKIKTFVYDHLYHRYNMLYSYVPIKYGFLST